MSEGVTPLEFMLQMMRQKTAHEDPKVQAMRETMAFEAAKAAAPYVHPKLAAIEHTGEDGAPLQVAPVFNIMLTTDDQ
jgi:hypothetical protein